MCVCVCVCVCVFVCVSAIFHSFSSSKLMNQSSLFRSNKEQSFKQLPVVATPS